MVFSLRTDKAILFWFKNEAIQAIFHDRSTIVFYNDQGLYINKSLERTIFTFSRFDTAEETIKKRVLYVLNVIQNLKPRQPPNSEK